VIPLENDLESKNSTRERILHATLRMIGNEGLQSVTTRKIAAAADVNIAAINYHFGSKDNVINEALKILMHKLIRSYDYLDDVTVPLECRLRNFLFSFADTALEHPDVFRNFINRAMNNSNVPFEYNDFMRKIGLEKLKIIIREITQIQDNDILLMKIFQMFSSLEYPVLLGNQMKDFAKFDYDDQDHRYKYVELLLKSVLNV
jgi:AcrR family transcriptional regulator